MTELSVRQRKLALRANGGDAPAERLGPTASTATRVEAFLDIGIEFEELADALNVTAATVRNWLNHEATPRRAAVRTIDDLRRVIVVLSGFGIEGRDAAQWLRSRQGGALEDERPLDVIHKDPVRVLAAANGLAFDKEDEDQMDLRAASESA